MLRRKSYSVPFDVLVLCQDAAWAESKLLYDLDAEYAATFGDNRRIYRLKDGRFASLANRFEAIPASPPWMDFWNWWTEYQTPGVRDFEEAAIINKMLKERHDRSR